MPSSKIRIDMAPHKDKWVRRFLVNETNRHKLGFTVYKVTSVIFLKSSPDTASRVSVWKRYNDFKKLHAALEILHGTLRIKEPFPRFPKPRFFGRFEAEVIEDRRDAAVGFLEFVAKHSSLFTSDVFVKFFETSHGDDCAADCSQSISSDTSEDDRTGIPESSENFRSGNPGKNGTNENLLDREDDRSAILDTIERSEYFRAGNPRKNGINENPPDREDDAILNAISMDSEYKFDNNNVDRGTKDSSWLRFLSVEKLAENGKNATFGSHDGADLTDSGQYILIAAAHMSAGFRHEAIAEYEEAYMQYKLGISNLRQGVQKDPDIARRATIIEKIVKYSERADRLYNRHLNCNISMISKPISELQYYKVLRVMGSVMLVKDQHQGMTRVIKTVEKPAGVQADMNKYILRGKVPNMVQLHACIQTETTVFLILQYASGGKLWDFLRIHHAIPRGKASSRKRNCARSTSCEAIINLNSERRTNPSRDLSNGGRPSNYEETEISPSFEATESPMSPENLYSSPDESLRRLEEEFGANSIYNKDLPTTQLLEKAQQLLKSVDATIKKSNSIASRLNESGRLLYSTEQTDDPSREPHDCDNTEGSCDLSELSISDSFTDLSTSSDKGPEMSEKQVQGGNDAGNRVGKPTMLGRAALPEMDELQSENTDERSALDESDPMGSSRIERLHHDEDSGIEMEQELWRVPETILRSWAARMLLALEALHQQDVVVADLRPDNLLVDQDGQILLTYTVPRQSPELSRYHRPYTAPELCMFMAVFSATPAADVWSFGVLLYELFTGIPFQSRHPGPFHSHSIISIPSELSESAKSLLSKILRFEPAERLTIPEIKQLPFFERIDWLALLNA